MNRRDEMGLTPALRGAYDACLAIEARGEPVTIEALMAERYAIRCRAANWIRELKAAGRWRPGWVGPIRGVNAEYRRVQRSFARREFERREARRDRLPAKARYGRSVSLMGMRARGYAASLEEFRTGVAGCMVHGPAGAK